MRRQQRERAAGTHAQAFHGALVGHRAAVHIGADFHRLADTHVGELGFLEVGVDPYAMQRHHCHQRHTGRHALAQLHRALGDIAIHRRDDGGAHVIEVGAAQLGRGRLDVRMGSDHGVIDQHIAALVLLLGRGQRALRAGQRIQRMRQLFRRDGAGLGQVATTVEISLGLVHRHLAHGYFRLRAIHIAIQAAHPAHGAAEVRLGLGQRDIGIGRVELYQHVAGMYQVAVIGADGHHGTGHHRSDLHQVAVHVGIVGTFVPAAIEEVPQAKADGGEHQHGDEHAQQETAAALRRLDRGRVVGREWGLARHGDSL